MVIGLALWTAAFAQEPTSRFVDAGQTVTAQVPSWLVPEATADRCLALDAEIAILERGLADCEGVCKPALEDARAALVVAKERMAIDSAELIRCADRQAELAVRVERLQRQRNTAWLVTGIVAVVAAGAGGLGVAL